MFVCIYIIVKYFSLSIISFCGLYSITPESFLKATSSTIPIWHYARDVEHNGCIKVPWVSLAHEGSIDDVQRWQALCLFFVRRRAIDSRNHIDPRWQSNRRIIKISKSLSPIKSRERRGDEGNRRDGEGGWESSINFQCLATGG